MNNSLRVIFAGSSNFSSKHLESLISSDYTIVSVYTRANRPAGRGYKLIENPVEHLARRNGIPIIQTGNFASLEDRLKFESLKPDLLVVAAYGIIIPKYILDIPRLGSINSHASLLPRWRGAAPIQRAIQAGDKTTGITIIRMESGIDTGRILLKASTPIKYNDTSNSLHTRLSELGAITLLDAIKEVEKSFILGEIQDDKLASYAHKLTKKEASINWKLPAAELERQIRAFNPWPISYSSFKDSILKIYSSYVVDKEDLPGRIISIDKSGLIIGCGKKSLCVTTLQFPGGKILNSTEVSNASWRGSLIGKFLGSSNGS